MRSIIVIYQNNSNTVLINVKTSNLLFVNCFVQDSLVKKKGQFRLYYKLCWEDIQEFQLLRRRWIVELVASTSIGPTSPFIFRNWKLYQSTIRKSNIFRHFNIISSILNFCLENNAVSSKWLTFIGHINNILSKYSPKFKKHSFSGFLETKLMVRHSKILLPFRRVPLMVVCLEQAPRE